MSVAMLNLVFGNSRSRPATWAVLLALADRANDAGECWPSLRDIAERSGYGRRGVQKAIAELVASGELSIAEAGGNGPRDSHRYRITLTESTGRVNGGAPFKGERRCAQTTINHH